MIHSSKRDVDKLQVLLGYHEPQSPFIQSFPKDYPSLSYDKLDKIQPHEYFERVHTHVHTHMVNQTNKAAHLY
jgi:hypothetical protein